MQNSQQDALAIAQNGGHPSDDPDVDDMDDGLDDDMMDKISSSPSIEDGALPRVSIWPSHRGPPPGRLLHLYRNAGASYPKHRGALPAPNLPATMFASSGAASLLIRGLEANKCPENHQGGHVPIALAQSLAIVFDKETRTRHHHSTSPGNEKEFHFLSVKSDSDSSSEEGLTPSSSFPDSFYFIDSGWGGECLHDLEDIDFEFVYALHTFVATVEGQANATKGDTMVLLDDSNSYWWLVRVVKDSSIGYLPAEHIETPTERLARLNKHRNIDVGHSHECTSPIPLIGGLPHL